MGTTALIVAGGGARSILTLGYLKAVQDLGVKYHAVYGTSAGALNASLLLQGDLPLAEELWLNIKTSDVYNYGIINFLKTFLGKIAIFDATPLDKLLRTHINYQKLYRNPIPFTINTTNMTTWEPLSLQASTLDSEELFTFLRASSSPPVAFNPVSFRGQMLCDGGIVNNFSITQAIKDGHTTLIILTPTRTEPAPLKTILDVVSLMFSLPEYGYFNRELACLERINEMIEDANIPTNPALQPIKFVVIKPPKPTGISLLDFSYAGLDRKDLIKSGYDLAYSTLKAVGY